MKAYFGSPKGVGFSPGFHFSLCASWGMVCGDCEKAEAGPDSLPLPRPFQPIVFLYNPIEICFWLECSWEQSKNIFSFVHENVPSLYESSVRATTFKWRQLEIIKETCSGQWLKQGGISTLCLSLFLWYFKQVSIAFETWISPLTMRVGKLFYSFTS